MLKPCKIKDLHTQTLNTPEHVPSPRAATAFTKAQPALHNTSSTTHSLLLPPHTPYYSHFQQPFRLHIPIHLHSFHTSLHPHFRQPFLTPHNSLPTPFPHLSIHTFHFHTFHHTFHFHHTLSTNTYYW